MDEQKKDGEGKNGSKGNAYVCTCCGHYSGAADGMGGGCACGCGGWGHGHWHGGMLLRIVIALLVALFIFWVGVKVGGVRSELYGARGYGYPGMMGGYGRGGNYPGGVMPGGVLRGGGIPAVPTNGNAATSSPAK